MEIQSFPLMCNWRHGYFKRHTCVVLREAGESEDAIPRCFHPGCRAAGLPGCRAAGISTVRGGNSSGAGQLFLLTFPLKAKGYSLEWCSGTGFAYSFGRMKSMTPILEQVYEILDYFHYRRGKSKWFNFSLE